MPDPVYTIGHSTHPADAFVALLQAHRIRQVADVRLLPKSARHPHFAREPLADLLGRRGVTYRHFLDLGGHRRPKADSVNTAWRVAAFRGYADYMDTAPFQRALDDLLRFAAAAPTAVMCAEAVWWQCHRRLLADALVVRGAPVLHVLTTAPPKPHELNEFARVEAYRLSYPGLL